LRAESVSQQLVELNGAANLEREPVDAAVMKNAIKWLGSQSHSRKSLMGIACRGDMTIVLTGKGEKDPGPFAPLILDFRKHLAN
jgi:hypothetical protein